MIGKKKQSAIEIEYNGDINKMTDESAHRKVKYTVGSDLSQFRTVYSFQLKKYVSEKKIMMPIILLVMIPIFAVVLMSIKTKLEIDMGASVDAFSAYLLLLMPICIIYITSKYNSKILSDDFSKKTGYIYLTLPIKRSVILLGRYAASLTMSIMTMVVVYVLVAVLDVCYYGTVPSTLLSSLGVAISLIFAYSGINLLLNTVLKSQTLASFAICFITIPAIMMILCAKDIVAMSTLQYIFPLADSITATIGTGFGGFSLLTMFSPILQTPILSITSIDSILLGIAWGVFTLAITIIRYNNKEM